VVICQSFRSENAQPLEEDMERSDEKIIESPVEARQGFRGRPVLIVLVVSCTLAIVALALSFAGIFGHA
jgi:hypothetical protein